MFEIKNLKNIELPLENCKICGTPTNPYDMVLIPPCSKICGRCYATFYTSKQKPKTNFDRITESVESLAEIMDNYRWCPYFSNSTCDSEIECIECIKEWLQKEIEE